MDGCLHRSRGSAARVHVDQEVRPPLQCPLPGRQDVPAARGDRGGGGPAGVRLPGPAPSRNPLLRPVLPRVGHPGHPRHPPAGLPGAVVFRRCLQASGPARPSVSPRLHRQVCGTVHRPGHPRRAPRHRQRVDRLSRRPHRLDDAAHREADARGLGGPGFREGRTPSGRPRGDAPGDGEAGRRAR